MDATGKCGIVLRGVSSAGYTIVEVLVSVGIALAILGITLPLTGALRRGFERETQVARAGEAVERAFDELCLEISRAGYGLEPGIPPLVPLTSPDSRSSIAVRSSPILTPVEGEPSSGEPPRREVEEVGFFLRPAPDGNGSWLVKSTSDRPDLVLAGGVEDLRFEYLDEQGRELSPETIGRFGGLRTVKISLAFAATDVLGKRSLTSAVTLDRQSTVVSFVEPGYGLRMSRFFYPIVGPTAVASGARDGVTAILSAGLHASQDSPYLLTFPPVKNLLDARVEQFVWLGEARGPSGACFGADGTAVAGELFLLSAAPRAGELHQVRLGDGSLQPATVRSHGPTEKLAQASGIVCGADGSIYAASGSQPALYRFRIDADGSSSPTAESLARFPGRPAAIALGSDGAVYVAAEMGPGSDLWKVPLTGERASRKIASFPARLASLTADPIAGSLYALFQSGIDTTVVELDAHFFLYPREIPPPLFSLEAFRKETNAPPAPKPADYASVSSFVLSPRLPPPLVPDEIDFIAFDASGFLYLGARERSLVLQFDLDRADDPAYTVTLAATVEPTRADVVGPPAVRLHAWRN